MSNVARRHTIYRLKRQFDDALLWVQERAVGLGVISLGTSAWLWMDFSAHYDLGIGLFSSSTSPALPALLIVSAFLSIVLMIILFVPALCLVVPRSKQIGAWAEVSIGPEMQRPFIVALKKTCAWVLTAASQAAILLAVYVGSSMLGIVSAWLTVPVLLFFAPPAILFQKTITRSHFDFLLALFCGQCVEFLIIQSICGRFLIHARWHTSADIAWFCCQVIMAAIATAILQAGIALNMPHIRRTRNIFIRAIVVSQIVLLSMAVISPLGAWIVSVPVRLMGMNGEKCVVLEISDPSKVDKDLIAHGSRSKPLNFVTPLIDENRYVQLRDGDGKTLAIPKAVSSAPIRCSMEESSLSYAAASAPHDADTDKDIDRP